MREVPKIRRGTPRRPQGFHDSTVVLMDANGHVVARMTPTEFLRTRPTTPDLERSGASPLSATLWRSRRVTRT